MTPQPDTRTVWEQTGKKPKTRFGDIIPCETNKCRWKGRPAVDRWECDYDCPYHMCAQCSIRLAPQMIQLGWKRVPSWKQPA